MTLNTCEELCCEESVTWLPQQEVSEIPWIFPDFLLKITVKFPWPTELTIAQFVLILDSTFRAQPSPLPIYLFMLSANHVQKKDWFSVKPNISLLFNFANSDQQYCTKSTRFMSVKCTNVLLKFPLFLTSFKDFNFPWLEVKFPEFSLTLKNIFFPFPDLWQPCQLYTANLYLNKKLLMLLMLAYTVQTQHVTHSIVIHFLFGDICKYTRKLSWR